MNALRHLVLLATVLYAVTAIPLPAYASPGDDTLTRSGDTVTSIATTNFGDGPPKPRKRGWDYGG